MLRLFIIFIMLSPSMGAAPKLNLLQNLRRWLQSPTTQKTDYSVAGTTMPTNFSVSLVEEETKKFEDNLRRVYPILQNSLTKFYFFREEFGDSEIRMNDVIRCMERVEYAQFSTVIIEGKSADKLYIVESGFLDVIIHGHYVRTLQASDMFGELALLYDSPRSATVIAKTDAILWTLDKVAFKKVQDQCVFD